MDILEIRRKAKARRERERAAAPARSPVEAPAAAAAEHARAVEPPPPADAPTLPRQPQEAAPAPVAQHSAVVAEPTEEDLREAADERLLEEFFASARDAAIDRFADPAFVLSIQSIARVDPDRVRFLAFRVGAEEYGIDLRFTREILKPQPLTPVPRAPAGILGVISIRGQVLPVVDLGARLCCEGVGPRRDERYIFIEYQGEGLCVRVDAVSNVVGFSGKEIEPAPVGLRAIEEDFVLGIGRIDERMIILLNVDEVIGGIVRRGG